MRRVRVKICGITRIQDVDISVAAGADALGFLVGIPSSPRNLTLERAARLMNRVPAFVSRVLVTDCRSAEKLGEMCDKLKPTAIQIHGEKPIRSSVIQERTQNVRLIRAVYASGNSVERAKESSKAFDAILLDSFVQGRYGGTGIVHDWNLSKTINETIKPTPLILAGGLKPENVKEAILTVKPYAVDVATGVELRPAIKDPKKVLAFVEKAKEVMI